MVSDINLKRRILEISYKHKLSHLGSCLTAVDIIDTIYSNKKNSDPFILSAGHAGLALYVVLEKHLGKNAEELFLKHGVHPNRDVDDGIFCSTGSLGHGLPIACGMAAANKNITVYCLLTDGECAEGSIWESFNYIEKASLNNIRIYVNANGFSAYDSIDVDRLKRKLHAYELPNSITLVETKVEIPFLHSIQAHYHVMNEEDYKTAMEVYETAV